MTMKTATADGRARRHLLGREHVMRENTVIGQLDSVGLWQLSGTSERAPDCMRAALRQGAFKDRPLPGPVGDRTGAVSLRPLEASGTFRSQALVYLGEAVPDK